MACRCQRPLFSLSTEIQGEKLVITLPDVNLHNTSLLDMVITQTIPATEPIPVVISFSSCRAQYPLMTRNGNYIYSDQIRNRKLYIFRYMSDGQLLFNTGSCNLKYTTFNYPILSAPETRIGDADARD